jgi:hypothetical protein
MDSLIIWAIPISISLGALGLTIYNNWRLKKTDEFKIVGGLLSQLHNLTSVYNMAEVPVNDKDQVDPFHQEKLDRMVDSILAHLNWDSHLVLRKEIKDDGLKEYLGNGVVYSYDKFFSPNKDKFPEDHLVDFKQFYKDYTKEHPKKIKQIKSSSNNKS